MKDKFKYIDIILILSLLIIIVSLHKIEEFADTSGNRVADTSGNRVSDTSGNKIPAWKPPKADQGEFWYTIIFITLIIISIISLSLFVYSYVKNEPSFLYATIGLSSIIIFLLIYLNKYE